MSKEESVLDTLLDLMGYSLIGLAMQDGKWNDSKLDKNIHSKEYRSGVYSKLDDLFARKLRDYGTKDLSDVGQIAQRMHEKLYRIENLIKGSADMANVLRIKKHSDEHPAILRPQKAGDVGFDMVVYEDTTLEPGVATNVPCGFSAKIPAGHWAEIRPRSSTASKLGVLVVQSVMDEGYTGPWFVVCAPIGTKTLKVEKGTRLAQCIIHKSVVPPVEFVNELPETERGATGFGSSGIKA